MSSESPPCAWCGCEKESHISGTGLCCAEDCKCMHYAPGAFGTFEQVKGATVNSAYLKIHIMLNELGEIERNVKNVLYRIEELKKRIDT